LSPAPRPHSPKWIKTAQSIIITGSRQQADRQEGLGVVQTFCGSLAPVLEAGFPRDFFSRGSHWVEHVRTCACASSYLPYVSETGTVFESLQIGETCTNLRPPPWTTLGRAPRLRWGVIV
jgi:hypothetical protein